LISPVIEMTQKRNVNTTQNFLSSQTNMETKASQIDQLRSVEAKVSKLIARYQGLQRELSTALSEIKRLETALGEKEQEIKNFQNQENIGKIVNTIAADAANATELKLKINEYIREIDKCIAYLRD